MPDVNTAESLRDWLRGCPAFDRGNRFRVDYLGAAPTEYAIFMVPSSLIYKTDILDNTTCADKQSLNFIIASREVYGTDVLQNLANLGFFDAIRDWIYEQNKIKAFPEIREGAVLSIMPTLTQYVFSAGTDNARYQIQCKLEYRRYS